MLNLQWKNIWSEEELYNLQVEAVTGFMQCDSQHSVEAAVEFAKYLNKKKLDSDNYPIFLEILREENSNVTEALIGEEKAFNFFKRVQPNYYIIDFCFQVLYKYSPGEVHDKTLELIYGVVYANFHRAKEGYALYPLSIENLNSIGKFLDKSKKQSQGVNRFVLDILSDIAEYKTKDEKDEINKISAHAIAIRNAFYDKRLEMNTVMPKDLVERKNYMETLINPRKTRLFA